MVSVLGRKLLRDLWRLKAQVVTVALLVAAGTGVLIGSASSYLSLLAARDETYRTARFADVFADLSRAPLAIADRIRDVPGVAVAEPRVTGDVRIDWPASAVAVSGRLMSVPPAAEDVLDRVAVTEGRWPEPGRGEVLLHAAFAESWDVRPGARLRGIVEGRAAAFDVVGIAQSPEFVYAARPGSLFPDDRTFAALWAPEADVARAFDMDGAFDSLSIRLAPGANQEAVIAAVDAVLDPWGGRGAYSRAEQASDRFLSDELTEQRTVAIVAPLVFFAVAGFLLNVVLGRLVDLQREQIAALKALGFPTLPIVTHYLTFAAAIWGLGAGLGVGLGILQGSATLEAYRPFFRFADLSLVVPAWLPLAALAASGALTVGATTTAVLRVLRLPPAVAMQASAPTTFRAAGWLRGARLHPSATMVLRSTLGRPLRTLLTVLGLALALPITVLGLFWFDALDDMRSIQFGAIERADAVVALTDALPRTAVREFERLPGVLLAEGGRSVPVRLSAGAARHRTALTGVRDGASLSVPRDADLNPIRVPPGGLVLSRRLAGKLAVGLGDTVAVDVLTGRRQSGAMPVVGLVDDILGMTASVEAGTLARFLSEGERVTEVRLMVDSAHADALWRALAERPKVAGVSTRSAILTVFDDLVAGLLTVSAAILAGFGVLITVGVVYNSARIGFHERSRELASLRILGFTRSEVARLLFAEFALMTAVAIPIGLATAQGLVTWILSSRANESFDLPSRVSPATFALATLIVAGAAAASSLAVRRRIDRLDLVAILKARD